MALDVLDRKPSSELLDESWSSPKTVVGVPSFDSIFTFLIHRCGTGGFGGVLFTRGRSRALYASQGACRKTTKRVPGTKLFLVYAGNSRSVILQRFSRRKNTVFFQVDIH